MVHRKTSNVFKPWKLSLAVVTIDHYLHLFDLPAHATATLATPPREAFEWITPRQGAGDTSSSSSSPSKAMKVFRKDDEHKGGIGR